MTLYVIRHGQTNYNLLGLCNDDPSKNVTLTETGLRQAEAAAKQLAHAQLSKIYVSELPRTHQTAEVINRYHNAPVVINPCLNDIRTGFDSQPVEDYFTATKHDRYNFTPPGGESVKEFQNRVLRILEVLKQSDHKSVLLVTHEEAMRVFYAYFNKLNPQQMLELNFGNCEVVKFTL